jgi:CrcB protein
MLALAVAVAGGAGAILRYVVDGAVQDRTSGVMPYGTIVVNIAGSLLMGLVTGLALFHGAGSDLVAVAGAGFCGGFTTWSAAAWEMVQLIEDDDGPAALLTAAATCAGGLAAAGCGLALAAL